MTKPSRVTQNKRPDSDPSPGKKSSAEKNQRTPLWQAFLLPVGAVLIFFLLMEGGLALFGVRPTLHSEDPFVGFADNVPLFVPSSSPGSQNLFVTSHNKRNYFNSQSFLREKRPETYRIFCLGGSTTYGRPYSDNTSFAGWLRELLPAADRQKHWEVVNAGGISYASYRVAHLMEELVNYQPDLFIIYTGHNEFLEERTYSQLRDVPEAVRSTVSTLARTRTWAAMTTTLKRLGAYPQAQEEGRDQLSGEINAILDQSAGLERYTRDDRLQENILRHYRLSLERMVALAKSVGAQVIFVTPASDLKDCSPFKSEHTPGLDSESVQRSAALLAKAKNAIGQEDWPGALDSLDTALAFDPRHAELHYRRGLVLLALGRATEADAALRQAREEDVCPLRALAPMQSVVAEVAREQNVALVDYVALLEGRMQSLYGQISPGKEYFLDHVHPTIEGHQVLATELVRTMVEMGLVEPGPEWGDSAVAAVAKKVESRIDKETHGKALASLARVLLWAGKDEEAGRSARQALDIGGEYLPVSADATSILSTIYQKQGRPDLAVDMLYTAIERAPGGVELRLKLGQLLANPPFLRYEEAAANFLLVCQQMPHYDYGHMAYGITMAKRSRFDIAYPSLLEALRLNPKNIEAQKTLNQISFLLKGKTPNPQLPQVMLDVYPIRAPRKLAQMRRDPGGRFVPDGIEVEWYENGRLKSFRDISRGVQNGLELTWSPDGEVLSRTRYRNGKPIINDAG